MSSSNSEALFATAKTRLPGGVSSPVRAFGKVGGTPRYMSKGNGARVVDEDGNSYVDFCMAWGPLILGHAHPAVVESVIRAARDGLAFGTVHRHEVELAELVLAAFPEHQLARFVVSGTEAVHTALRLARAATNRNAILKFTGCYHGHVDSLLVRAGSGVVTQGLADSAGVSAAVAAQTTVVPLDDEAALEQAFALHGSSLAAAIVEPLPANNGLLPQRAKWLQRLRQLCDAHGSLLIFDEVISGFRFHFGGYGRLVGVRPDLTTLGKVVGGGLPVAAVVGRRDVMERLAPLGPVYQAGTMAGNPVALAAGVATLKQLRQPEVYMQLEKLGAALQAKLAARVPKLQVARVGSLVWPYFGASLPMTAEAIETSAIDSYHQRYHRWLASGVYLPPSGYEVSFLSTAHSLVDIDLFANALAQESTSA